MVENSERRDASVVYRTVGALLSASCLALAAGARAQDGVDRVLSVADVVESEQCAVLRVGFNLPVNMVSSFPQETGSDLRIRVKAAGGGLDAGALKQRESLRPPASILASITNITFDGDNAEGPSLNISFRHPVYFHVAQGSDFRSLVVAISNHPDTACTPNFKPIAAAEGGDTPPPATAPQPRRPAGDLPLPAPTSDANANAVAITRLQDARTALTAKDYPRAIQLLTAVVEAPESGLTPEAIELLGLARERNGQLAHAKAEYEEFLRRYPTGDASDRVRQRLAGVLAVGSAPKAALRPSGLRGPQQPDLAWEVGGSVSAYYLYDDGFHKSDDTASGSVTKDEILNQNQFLGTLDGIATVRSRRVIARARVSATFTEDMLPGSRNQGTLSALYVEAMDTKQILFGRVGRQTRSTGGVLGRFDGGLFTYRILPTVKLEVAAGHPVDSSKILYMDTGRTFVATSLALGRFNKAWDGDVYFVRQNNHGLIDREAVGGELRYLDMTRSLFASLDYDVHFKRVNFALLNANLTLKDKTTISLALDYRASPLLTTGNALIGQTVTNVQDLVPTYGVDGVYQLALDRTADSKSATLSVAHPLNEKFSINADATVSQIGATPASGGAPAGPSTGTEEYLSAQVIGSGLLKEGDLGILGVRFANTQASQRYVLDINTRYPISRALRVNPRLILSYRDNKLTPGSELSTKPSVRINYYFRKHYQFELESGGEWTVNRTDVSNDRTLGYYLNVGFRADF